MVILHQSITEEQREKNAKHFERRHLGVLMRGSHRENKVHGPMFTMLQIPYFLQAGVLSSKYYNIQYRTLTSMYVLLRNLLSSSAQE